MTKTPASKTWGIGAGAAVTALALLGAASAPAAAAPAKTDGGDISGFWIPRAASAAGAPKADLTPEFVALSKDPKAIAPGRTLEYLRRWCVHVGMPSGMFTSGTIDIVQTRKEVGILFEVGGAAQRYIYTDGRRIPSEDVLDNTTNGFSVGHWQGDALVVETRGFTATGVRDIPGGGWRGEGSHLTERFELADGGKTLKVTETWTDPKVFAKPHSYTLVYDRAPAGYSAKEVYCDGRFPDRAKPVFVGNY